MDEVGIDMYKVVDILNQGFDCPRSKREKYRGIFNYPLTVQEIYEYLITSAKNIKSKKIENLLNIISKRPDDEEELVLFN